MACNSVAVSKAQIAQIALAKEELVTMLSKLLGITPQEVHFFQKNVGERAYTHGGSEITMKYDYAHAAYSGRKYAGVDSIAIVQRVVSGKITLELSVSTDNYHVKRGQEVQEELAQAFERQSTVAQQTTVLKKLAALGKLSSITQKDNGVTARIEITL